jgi:hypothetical protein
VREGGVVREGVRGGWGERGGGEEGIEGKRIPDLCVSRKMGFIKIQISKLRSFLPVSCDKKQLFRCDKEKFHGPFFISLQKANANSDTFSNSVL